MKVESKAGRMEFDTTATSAFPSDENEKFSEGKVSVAYMDVVFRLLREWE